jgi:hypothetical protein
LGYNIGFVSSRAWSLGHRLSCEGKIAGDLDGKKLGLKRWIFTAPGEGVPLPGMVFTRNTSKQYRCVLIPFLLRNYNTDVFAQKSPIRLPCITIRQSSTGSKNSGSPLLIASNMVTFELSCLTILIFNSRFPMLALPNTVSLNTIRSRKEKK